MLLITGTIIMFLGDNYPLYGILFIMIAIWAEAIATEEED
jgi:hypothetical protein